MTSNVSMQKANISHTISYGRNIGLNTFLHIYPFLARVTHHAIWSGSALCAFWFIRLFVTKKLTVQILIRWQRCACWSRSTLVAHALKCVFME
jgi:hypothetical protein